MQQYTLVDLLEDYEPFHSDLQIDSFILRRNGAFHPYGIYKQALVELKDRFQTLVEVLRQQRYSLPDGPDTDVAPLEQVQRALSHKNHAALFNEFVRFYAWCCTLKDQLCPGGAMTAVRRAQLTEELWEFRLKFSVAMDCRYHGMPARNTVEQVLCMPHALRTRLLAFMDDRTQQATFWGELVDGKDLELPATRSPEFVEHLQHLLAERITNAHTPQATP